MKNGLIAIGGIGLLLGILFYAGFFDMPDDKQDTAETPAPPPPADPTTNYGPQTGIGAGLQMQKAPYFSNEGQGKEAIEARMLVLFNDKTNRLKMIRENGISNNLYSGTAYPDGMKQVFISVFGNASNLPIIPSIIDGGEFIETMKSLQELKNINTLESGGNLDSAKSTYRNASTLSDGTTLWPGNLQTFLDQGFFGDAGKADRNKSNLWDRYGEDLKRVAKNLVNASNDLEFILRSKAIEDLKKAGWVFVDA